MDDQFSGIKAMAGGICHSINQPLQVLLTSVELFHLKNQDKLLDSDGRRYLETIENSIDRIKKIVSKVEDIAKEKERVEFRPYQNNWIVDLEK